MIQARVSAYIGEAKVLAAELALSGIDGERKP
jgi:hypothetical protein